MENTVIYNFKVEAVKYGLGKIKEIIVAGEGEKAVFIIKNGKVVLKPGQQVLKKYYSFMHAEARRRFEAENKALQNKLANKARKNIHNKFFIPRLDNIAKTAWELNDKIKAFKKRHYSLTLAEAAFEVIKAERNNPVRWQALSKKDSDWLWALRKKGGLKILTEGWINISRWLKKEDRKPRLIPQKVESINHALRQVDHTLDNYKLNRKEKPGELALLESMEEIIENVNRMLVGIEKLNKAENLKHQKKIAVQILKIENCTNEKKVKLKKQLINILPLKDSRNRINPGAMAARTIAALNHLGKRFLELELIIPYHAMRRELLIFEERRVKTAIRKALDKTRLASRISPRGQGLIKILENIKRAEIFLKNVRVSPYWEISEQAKLYLLNAKRFLQSENYNEAKIMLLTAVKILETKT